MTFLKDYIIPFFGGILSLLLLGAIPGIFIVLCFIFDPPYSTPSTTCVYPTQHSSTYVCGVEVH
jgi:hypothetical protein